MRRVLRRMCQAATATQQHAAASTGSVTTASSTSQELGTTATSTSASLKFARLNGLSDFHISVGSSASRPSRAGRGLVVTDDVKTNTLLLRAPLDKFGITVASLAINTRRKLSELDRRLARGDTSVASVSRELLASAAQSVPPGHHVLQRTVEGGCKDHFVAGQMYLAMWLALERCDALSPMRPYLDELPHPAIDDEAVLQAHDATMDKYHRMEFDSHRAQFHRIITTLHRDWSAAARSAAAHRQQAQAMSADGQQAMASSNYGVPPIAVLHWAWRTVLARQFPMPPVHDPKHRIMEAPKRGLLDYVTSWTLSGESQKLLPTLLPIFDFIDHDPCANVVLDVVMKPLASVSKDTTGGGNAAAEADSAAAEEALREVDPSLAEQGPHRTFVELRASEEISAATPLLISYSQVHSLAFALYRFGFLPIR